MPQEGAPLPFESEARGRPSSPSASASRRSISGMACRCPSRSAYTGPDAVARTSRRAPSVRCSTAKAMPRFEGLPWNMHALLPFALWQKWRTASVLQ